jgi:23S rRNA pseudouridine1911/1915/1917 synthase
MVPREQAGHRLDRVIAILIPQCSRSRLQQWIKQGHLLVDGKRSESSRKVWGGERIRLDMQPDPSARAYAPQALALNIVYEDDTLLVVNKPPGLVVHPGSGNWDGTLLNALLHHEPGLEAVARAGIVHRLDKGTSGLLVVAKTPVAQTSLVRQLQARTVKREYLALAEGVVPRGGRVEAPLGRHPRERTKIAVVATGKPAVTHFEALESLVSVTLIRCRLETGRTHQIRVHMQSIGHPLLGDPVYGSKRSSAAAGLVSTLGFRRQALHAATLQLVHPQSGQTISWSAPLPEDMLNLLEALRRAARADS